MAKATTLNVTGNREDLTDILSLMEPEMTPFTSMAKKKKANATFVEWQTDALEEPVFGGVDEGADVTSFENKGKNRARLGNYIQKERRTFAVSDVQELVNTAGVASEFARAQAIAARELKRDVESANCSSQDRQAEGGAGTPSKTRGIFRWLGYNGTAGGNYPSDIPADQQINAYDATTPITEALFNDVMQTLYTNNGAPGSAYALIPDPTFKQDVTDFTRASDSTYRVTQSADDKAITFSVNFYDGDFGTVNIHRPSVFLDRTSGSATVSTGKALLVDPSQLSLYMLKAESRSELEDQGGGRRGYCDIIWALGCDAPKAHGFFY
jgi:hypothetical protein